MNNTSSKTLLKTLGSIAYIALGVIYFLAIACAKEIAPTETPEPPPIETEQFRIQETNVPGVFHVQQEVAVSIVGKGYKMDDKLILESLERPSNVHTLSIQSIQDDHMSITLPTTLVDGRYTLLIQRGSETQNLGTTRFITVLRSDIPDVDGKTIKGIVHVNGLGLPDVIVSDGQDVATTDQNGIYYLKSNKRTGYVFVSTPGGYEMKAKNGNLPLFYGFLYQAPNAVDIVDFELTPVNNDNHVVLALADMHLANRNNDLNQFQQGFIADVNQQIAHLKSQGKQVYALTLGDQTWETYWYSNNYMLPEYVKEISTLQATVFNTIGNHDNDPYFSNDWMAENAYRRILGPTYYSFNLGKVHYVVLDNVEYINNGGASGIVGDRSYNAMFTDGQLEWLTKDLASVPATTPIVLSTHIPIYRAPTEQGNTPNFRTSNAQQLISLLDRFDEVHVLTGHTHVNYRVPRNNKLMEHNTAALSGTWWWTGRPGYSDNHIAPDGSPGGYGLWEMNGTDIAWKYKSIGYAPEYQFRAYDLNQVHITAAKHAPAANATFRAMVPQYAADFAKENKNNEVLINVWGYDPKWTVSVTENGKTLDVQRVSSHDPLQIISYGMQRLNVNATPTFDAANTSHMFKAKATTANSTLQITVTDRFGTSYHETMERPKAFTYSMR